MSERAYMSIISYIVLSGLAIGTIVYCLDADDWLDGRFYLNDNPDMTYGFTCGLYTCKSVNLDLNPDSTDVCDLFCDHEESYDRLELIQKAAPGSLGLAAFSFACFISLVFMCKCFCTNLESWLFVKSTLSFFAKLCCFFSFVGCIIVGTLFAMIMVDESIDYDYLGTAAYVWMSATLVCMFCTCSVMSLKPSDLCKKAPTVGNDETARLLSTYSAPNYVYVPLPPSAPPAYPTNSVNNDNTNANLQQQIYDLQSQLLQLQRQKQPQSQQKQQQQEQQRQPSSVAEVENEGPNNNNAAIL
eukprot:c13827_g1_i1.p1 GENE.c13827_g1_i1~~c13827_g1_i1.p1  ORF type:complete len:300 (+),score=4.96 c13827_g1_i1:62-961(+)